MIVTETDVLKLMLRYLGEGQELTHDETELLLFALYLESKDHGLAAQGIAVLEKRLKKQQAAISPSSSPKQTDPTVTTPPPDSTR